MQQVCLASGELLSSSQTLARDPHEIISGLIQGLCGAENLTLTLAASETSALPMVHPPIRSIRSIPLRIGFTVTTKAGAKVSVYADRCGLELPDGAMADGGMMYSSVSKLGAISASRFTPSRRLVAISR